jgi:pre-mRNA-splicing factor ATP-dependent RNA helicase DHX38/PRP16
VTLSALPFADKAEFSGRIDGINAVGERRDGGEKGLGEFQRRLNRDRRYEQRNWETPRSERGGSVRVPNVGWESTPRNSRSDGGGWGRVGNRSWDAQTPRVVRDTSPDGDDRAFGLDSREWEEEQVRLDRDWYTGAEEGGVAGDEEHNPLSQYEDLAATKEAEIASKQIVRSSLSCKISRTELFAEKGLREASTICEPQPVSARIFL